MEHQELEMKSQLEVTRRAITGDHLAKLALVILMGLVSMGCGPKLGKIRLEQVEQAISQSQVAIDQAFLKNANTLSPELWSQAEQQMAESEKARSANQGLTAIQLAYQAMATAQTAAHQASAVSKENELNAVIDKKSGKIEKLRAEMQQARSELKNAGSEANRTNQQKERRTSELKRKLQQQSDQVSRSQSDAHQAGHKRDQLQTRYDQVYAQSQPAQRQIEDYRRRIREYETQLAKAEAELQTARQASEEAKSRAIAQGKSYSRQIENLSQQRALRDHDAVLARKMAEARAFAQRRQTWTPNRTGQTALSRLQASEGRRELKRWDQAWWDKDLNTHLSYYSRQLQLEQSVIRATGEERKYLDYVQTAPAIRGQAGKGWSRNASADTPEIQAEGDSLVATYRLNKTSGGRQKQPVLYDIWEREVWIRKQGQAWRIYREFWRIYENVPKY